METHVPVSIRFEETGRSGISLSRSVKRFAEKQLSTWAEHFRGVDTAGERMKFYVSFRRNRDTGQVDCRVDARTRADRFFGYGFGSGAQQALSKAVQRIQYLTLSAPLATPA